MELDDFPCELEQLRREHSRQHPCQSMQYDLALIDPTSRASRVPT